MTEENRSRYHRALHAMQSGVATLLGLSAHGYRECEPKHLRVGINAALSDHGALVSLLIDKGVITLDEYEANLATYMEQEVRTHQEQLTKLLGKEVKLT